MGDKATVYIYTYSLSILASCLAAMVGSRSRRKSLCIRSHHFNPVLNPPLRGRELYDCVRVFYCGAWARLQVALSGFISPNPERDAMARIVPACLQKLQGRFGLNLTWCTSPNF